MQVAFNRVVEMKAGTSSGSVLISGLDISFDITRSRKFSNNVAKFKIYNLTQDTVSKMLKKGNSITFKAGYQDEGLGLIYIGQITQATLDKNTPDNIVTVECGSIQNANTKLSSVTVSLAYKKDTSLSRPINEIGTALGLAICGIENASSIRLSNGFNLAGTAKDAMRYIQGVLERNNLGLFIDNTNLKIFKKGEGENRKAVVLSTKTGLLESPKLTDNTEGDEKIQKQLSKRALFRSILNYKVVPNGYVDIRSEDVTGVFIVDKCNFTGDNFGGNFEVKGEAIGSDPEVVAAQRNSPRGAVQ